MRHGEGPGPAKDGRDKVGERLYWRGGPGIVGGWIAFEMPAGIGWLSFPRSGPRPEGQYRVFSFAPHLVWIKGPYGLCPPRGTYTKFPPPISPGLEGGSRIQRSWKANAPSPHPPPVVRTTLSHGHNQCYCYPSRHSSASVPQPQPSHPGTRCFPPCMQRGGQKALRVCHLIPSRARKESFPRHSPSYHLIAGASKSSFLQGS